MIANSAKAAGVLGNVSHETAEKLYGYGRDLGLAFQIVDDILFFSNEVVNSTQSSPDQSIKSVFDFSGVPLVATLETQTL